MEAHVLGDLAEAAARVVRVAHQEAPGLRRRAGRGPDWGFRRRRSSLRSASFIMMPLLSSRPMFCMRSLGGRVDLARGLLGRAVHAQAGRVHGVDGHVRPVRRGDHRLELREHAVGDRHALGEEHDRLAAGHALQALDHGQEAVAASRSPAGRARAPRSCASSRPGSGRCRDRRPRCPACWAAELAPVAAGAGAGRGDISAFSASSTRCSSVCRSLALSVEDTKLRARLGRRHVDRGADAVGVGGEVLDRVEREVDREHADEVAVAPGR